MDKPAAAEIHIRESLSILDDIIVDGDLPEKSKGLISDNWVTGQELSVAMIWARKGILEEMVCFIFVRSFLC